MRDIYRPVLIFILLMTIARPCTTFVIHDSTRLIFGRNYDYDLGLGFISINKRDVEKQAFVREPLTPAVWTARYGSITFNQVGIDAPMGGMNETGLVIAQMALPESEYPPVNDLPVVNQLEWIQYQLDNAASLAEVIENSQQIQIIPVATPVHYMVCDREGNMGILEYLAGKLVVHQGDDIVIPVSSNMPYRSAARAVKRYREFGGFNDLPKEWKTIPDIIALAAVGVRRSADHTNVVRQAFSILESVASPNRTQWSVVYDLYQKQIHVKTRANRELAVIDLKDLDFDCANDVAVIPINNTAVLKGKSFNREAYYRYKKELVQWFGSHIAGFPVIDDNMIAREVDHIFSRKCMGSDPGRSQPETASSSGTSYQEFIPYLEKRIPALMARYTVPGLTIALIKNGQTVWSGAFGYADLEAGRKMTVDTYCRVESISKSVTAWGLMKLVEQGRIDLDKPVITYLRSWHFPESRFDTENITVRQLLSHHAGLTLGTIGVRYAPDEALPTLRESLSHDAILREPPGTLFSYSNTGFNLLELLIEEVTGRDFAEYMATEILRPLGMNHSGFSWSPEWEPAVPFGYDLKGHPIPVYVYPAQASGGLFATVTDIATFLRAGMPEFNTAGTKVLSTLSLEQLYTPVVPIPGFYGMAFDAYGLGHFIEYLGEKKSVSHGGQGSGWMTHYQFIPETGDGIVILTNSQRSWPLFAALLRDWSEANGFPAPGMSRILVAQNGLWIIILLIISLGFWQLGRGIQDRTTKERAVSTGRLKLVPGTIALVIFSGLAGAYSREYFFLFSVFPVAADRLAQALLFLAVILFLRALSPMYNIQSMSGKP